jgi:hypothetical protein
MRAASLTGRLLAVKGRSAASTLLNRAVSTAIARAEIDGSQREPIVDARPTLDMVVTDAATPHQTVAESEPIPFLQSKKVVRMPAAVAEWTSDKAADISRKKVSVRLDAPRHFRLKLVAFKMNWSAQELMIRAFDKFVKKVAPEFADALPPGEGQDSASAADEALRTYEASVGRTD